MKRVKETDKYVGRRIKLRRVLLGMSQQQLATKLNMTFQQIQKYEKGVNRTSPAILQEIAKIFKVPINYFFDGCDQETPEISKKEIEVYNSIDKEFLGIARLLIKVKPKKRSCLLKVLKNLILSDLSNE